MCLVALVLGLVLTGAAIPTARWVGLTDRPDGRRKLQYRPVPVVGGVALFFAVVGAVGVGLLGSSSVREVMLPELAGGGGCWCRPR